MYITDVTNGTKPVTSNVIEPDSSHESKVRYNPTDGSMPSRELLLYNHTDLIPQFLRYICGGNINVYITLTRVLLLCFALTTNIRLPACTYLPSPLHSVGTFEQLVLSARLKRIAEKRNAIIVKIMV